MLTDERLREIAIEIAKLGEHDSQGEHNRGMLIGIELFAALTATRAKLKVVHEALRRLPYHLTNGSMNPYGPWPATCVFCQSKRDVGGMIREHHASNCPASPGFMEEGMSPYDPRPVSEGGNRGIDEDFRRKAPKGKFRVIGVDTFDGGDWCEGDFTTIEEAKAKAVGGEMLIKYVYDDQGKCIYSNGRF